MSTTPSHGFQAGLLAYYCLKVLGTVLRAHAPSIWETLTTRKRSIAVTLIAFATFFGMLPDLLGIYGHSHAALAARDHGDPNWLSVRDWNVPAGYYWRAHNADLYEMFKIVPFYALHIWVDKFFHKEEGGWNEQGYLLEVIIDTVMIILLWVEWRGCR